MFYNLFRAVHNEVGNEQIHCLSCAQYMVIKKTIIVTWKSKLMNAFLPDTLYIPLFMSSFNFRPICDMNLHCNLEKATVLHFYKAT